MLSYMYIIVFTQMIYTIRTQNIERKHPAAENPLNVDFCVVCAPCIIFAL